MKYRQINVLYHLKRNTEKVRLGYLLSYDTIVFNNLLVQELITAILNSNLILFTKTFNNTRSFTKPVSCRVKDIAA